MKFKFRVIGQELEVFYPKIYENTTDYLDAEFEFDNEWAGLAKEVYLTKGEDKYKIPLIEDKITRDKHINLSAGTWKAYVFGLDPKGTMIISTGTKSISIAKTGKREGTIPPEVPESEIDLILKKSQAAENKANEAVKTANNAMSTADTKAIEINSLIVEYNTSKEELLNAKDNAATSASNSKASEDNAATSASDANTYKLAAESAKTASETAKDLAEQAVTDATALVTAAETAQGKAETAKQGAETAQTLAEQARDEAVSTVASKADKTYVDDTFGSVIKVSKQGTVVSANDVSEIEHIVDVKIESANIFDPSKFRDSITLNGINFDISKTTGEIKLSGIATAATTLSLIYFKPFSISTGQVVLSGSTDDSVWLQLVLNDSVSTYATVANRGSLTNAITVKPDSQYTLNVRIESGTDCTGNSVFPMLNKGTEPLPYTPYVADLSTAKLNVNGTIYNVNADGSVDNVKSSPVMEMSTDKEGISIEATYHADTKKYIDNKFNELQNAIISTGGNI